MAAVQWTRTLLARCPRDLLFAGSCTWCDGATFSQGRVRLTVLVQQVMVATTPHTLWLDGRGLHCVCAQRGACVLAVTVVCARC